MPSDFYADNLLKSLNGGAEYGSHLANVMVILLRTLLQDEIAVVGFIAHLQQIFLQIFISFDL